jgi:fumarylpyruvate hydrolase
VKKPRRDFLNAGVALGAATVAACATPPQANAQRGDVLFAHEPSLVPVYGTDRRYAVRRIYCIGRNYAAHAREMGSDPAREPPFFFQKPTDAIQVAPPGTTIDHPYPPVTRNYHHEIELVAALGSGGRDIPADHALQHVFGYAAGLDMTRRDLQRAMGEQKKPWEIGKSFDHSAVITHIFPAEKTGHIAQGPIWLKVNGQVKQDANLDMMTWNVAEQVAHLSTLFELAAGDLIYCGTPENVGPVVRGDVMTGHVEGIYDLSVKVV